MVGYTDYYPFGMMMPGRVMSSLSNDFYKYNGKQLDDDYGLNWHDYGWRPYDAEIGRWVRVDPLAERYLSLSPYNYVLNSPINYFDLEGLSVRGVQDSIGKIIVTKNSFIPDNNPTLFVYDAEGNLVATYNLADIENILILQQLDNIARALGISGEDVRRSLYMDFTPARNFALGASWFVVGTSGISAAADLIPALSDLSQEEIRVLLTWFKSNLTSGRGISNLWNLFLHSTRLLGSAAAATLYYRLSPYFDKMVRIFYRASTVANSKTTRDVIEFTSNAVLPTPPDATTSLAGILGAALQKAKKWLEEKWR